MTDTDKRPLLYDPKPRKDIELPPRMPEADTIARLTADNDRLRRERDAALAGALDAGTLDKVGLTKWGVTTRSGPARTPDARSDP
jgi:phage portal protein BeeE